MYLELKETEWTEAHCTGASFNEDRWAVVMEWRDLCETEIAKEMAEFPDMLRGNNVFEMCPAPFTLLDPASLPQDPGDLYADPNVRPTPEQIGEAYGAWRDELARYGDPDLLESALIYFEDFNPENKAFTVVGSWTDECGAGGTWGFITDNTGAKKHTILFA